MDGCSFQEFVGLTSRFDLAGGNYLIEYRSAVSGTVLIEHCESQQPPPVGQQSAA
jgi:hypothetical protein